MGDIEARALAESSGLTASPTHADILWSINDSGGRPRIFAMKPDGTHVGYWWLADVMNLDWESLDSFVQNGDGFIAIGDVGDNFSWRNDTRIIVIAEPRDMRIEREVLPAAWVLEFEYPYGPVDCEAIAVDVDRERVLLLSKREYPPKLYSIPLSANAGEKITAEHLASLAGFPRPTILDYDEDRNARYRHMPTGMDISGSSLLVTTYQHAYLFDLDDLEAAPVRISMPTVGQREAITFEAGMRDIAYVSRERYEQRGVADIFRVSWKLHESSPTPEAAPSDD